MKGHAFFHEHPRTVDDLFQPHDIEIERPFEVVKTIQLSDMDFENFATDMVADRSFLEANACLCDKSGAVIRCLLVQRRSTAKGILVVPNKAWVDSAALFAY